MVRVIVLMSIRRAHLHACATIVASIFIGLQTAISGEVCLFFLSFWPFTRFAIFVLMASTAL